MSIRMLLERRRRRHDRPPPPVNWNRARNPQSFQIGTIGALTFWWSMILSRLPLFRIMLEEQPEPFKFFRVSVCGASACRSERLLRYRLPVYFGSAHGDV